MSRLEPDPRRPVHWSWRPAPWSGGFGTLAGTLETGGRAAGGVALYHDATEATGRLSGDAAGIALALEAFDGSYVSLAFDLPPEALALVSADRLFEAAVAVEAAPAPATWLRLCLQRGAGVARSVSAVEPRGAGTRAAIDLAVLAHPEVPGQGWVELLFDVRAGAQIAVPDLIFWISPRGRM